MRGRFVFVIVRIDVVPAHGVVDEPVPHQDAAQVGVAVEDDAEEVEDLALLEFRAAPDGRERGQMDCSARGPAVRMRRMTGPCFFSMREEVIDDFEIAGSMVFGLRRLPFSTPSTSFLTFTFSEISLAGQSMPVTLEQ